MAQAVIDTWAESLAVRVPRDIAELAGLCDGQRVEIVASTDAVIIRKLPSHSVLQAMFDGKSPETWRQLYADSYDWGPDRGREQLGE